MLLHDFLRSQSVWFQSLLHRPSSSSSRFAASLRVSGRRVAKGVLVRVDDGYVLAVLPATDRIDWNRLSEAFGGRRVALASEIEVERLFSDCERGALPPFGRLYGIPTVIDTSFEEGSDLVCAGNMRHGELAL